MTVILDTFDSPLRRCSLQDVAARTGLPSSTAHRILDQLVQLGWVEHGTSGYALGWRARQLAGRVDATAELREAAAPFLHDLAVHTPFIIHLAVLDGPHVRYLDKVGGHDATGVPSRVGGLLPAHLTAVGKAMLAYLETDALDTTLEDATSCGDATVDVTALHRELAGIRRRGGLSTERDSPVAAVACVGAPIFDQGGRVIGALSLCDAGKRMPLGRFAPLLHERAKRISAHISAAPSRGLR